jgi:hypothetical protein
VIRQERLLELKEREQEYIWQKHTGIPSTIRAEEIRHLPKNEQSLDIKYSLMVERDFEPAMINIIRRMINIEISNHNPETANKSQIATSKPLEHSSQTVESKPHATVSNQTPKTTAIANWKKVKKVTNAIKFIKHAKLPVGLRGLMCKPCNDDRDFGTLFVIGANPVLIRRCTAIPENFSVPEEDIAPFLNEKTLEKAIQVKKE